MDLDGDDKYSKGKQEKLISPNISTKFMKKTLQKLGLCSKSHVHTETSNKKKKKK